MFSNSSLSLWAYWKEFYEEEYGSLEKLSKIAICFWTLLLISSTWFSVSVVYRLLNPAPVPSVLLFAATILGVRWYSPLPIFELLELFNRPWPIFETDGCLYWVNVLEGTSSTTGTAVVILTCLPLLMFYSSSSFLARSWYFSSPSYLSS